MARTGVRMGKWLTWIMCLLWLTTLGCSSAEDSTPGLSFTSTSTGSGGTSGAASNDGADTQDASTSTNNTEDGADSADDEADTSDGVDASDRGEGDDASDATESSDGTDGTDSADTWDGTDSTDTPDPCGDGICADNETEETCPIDCGESTVTTCLEEKCSVELNACLDVNECVSIYACLLDCTEQPCAQECFVNGTAEGTELMNTALQCGQLKGCFGGPACGDGICEDTETEDSCPEDCSAPSCLELSCDPEITACVEDEGCSALYACYTACDTSSCQDTCFITATPAAIALMQLIVECGDNAGCITSEPVCGDSACESGENEENCPEDCASSSVCGDGTCDDAETADNCPEDCDAPAGSCMGTCLSPYDNDLPCQCDELCLAYGDCCSDFVGQCAAGNAFLCILDLCDVSGDCAGDDDCNAGVKCVANCTNGASCVEACAENSSENTQDAISTYGTCAISTMCIPSGMTEEPICGDGQCDTGETLESCAEDCPCGDGVCAENETFESCPTDCACGNGDCDDDESPENCPVDCQTPVTNTCDGSCLSDFTQGAACQCDQFCISYGDCCTDFESLCYDASNALLCIQEECDTGQQCLNDNGCQTGLLCISECEGQNCITQCVDGAPNNDKDDVATIGQCALTVGCIGPPPNPCGNSICDADETFESCPEDCTCSNGICEPTESPVSCAEDCGDVSFDLCITQACPSELSQCTGNFGCLMTLACINGCGDDTECIVGCFPSDNAAFDALQVCATTAGCLE